MNISRLTEKDFDNFIDHYSRNLNQSGLDGMPVFNFFSPGTFVVTPEIKKSVLSRNTQDISKPGWERTLIYKDDETIRGHILFRSAVSEASSHRLTLMMGIEREYVRKGIGSALLKEGLHWCNQRKEIHWVDLGVFEENIPAIKLYEKFNFQKEYLREDAFRIDGKSVSLINMTLKIK